MKCAKKLLYSNFFLFIYSVCVCGVHAYTRVSCMWAGIFQVHVCIYMCADIYMHLEAQHWHQAPSSVTLHSPFFEAGSFPEHN